MTKWPLNHWIDLRENLQETHGFLASNIGLSCKFSHNPILWLKIGKISSFRWKIWEIWDDFLNCFSGQIYQIYWKWCWMNVEIAISRCPSHDDHWMHAHELAAEAGIHLHLDHIASVGRPVGASRPRRQSDGCEWRQGGAPKIAKLVYKSHNYGLWQI